MSEYKIPMSFNHIDGDGLQKVLNRYKSVSHQKIITDFEDQIIELSNCGHAVALNSGTAALHLALRMINTGPGDIVLVSSFTYIATVAPIVYFGAEPVFIDSEPETWNMDPELMENAIVECINNGKRPKAIIVVHAYGMPAQMNKIMAIAGKFEIPVIEDAAEAFGALIGAKWAGTVGHMGIYSFNNNKSVTTFGGGVLVTANVGWAEKARKLAAHARENKPYYEHREIGYNYTIGPLSAAYGIWECGDWETKIEARRAVFEKYRSALGGMVTYQREDADTRSSRWLSTFRVRQHHKLSQIVDNEEFEIRKVWNPMHLQPVFKGQRAFLNGTAEALFKEAVCLPSGTIGAKDFMQLCTWLQMML